MLSRGGVRWLLLCCCAWWFAATSAGLAESSQRLNVLLIVSDDQRPDTIAALGNRTIETPHLDSLVRQGVVFRRAICANPLCVPSRAELLSGRDSFQNGFFQDGRLRSDLTLWPRVMQMVGYRTWYVGKWHTRGRPATCGYDDVDGLFAGGKAPDSPQLDRHGRPVTGYVGWQFQTDDGRLMPEKGIGLTPNISSEFADAAIRFLKRPHDQPFFLHVNFTAPHDPLFLPPNFEGRYRADQMSLPLNYLVQHPFDHGNLRGRDELLWPFPRTPEIVRDELAVYYAIITHLDQQIGRILKTLDEQQLANNTLVIFTSDHGLAIGSHGLRGKQNMYEHTINVPLIFRGPGLPRGEQRRAQCYLRDLLPTVLDLVGIQHNHRASVSLVPVLRDAQREVHPFVVGYFGNSQRMIRRGAFKLIRYPQASREQLFDLQSDPQERHNQIDNPAYATIVAELRQQLIEWLKARGEQAPASDAD